MIVKKQIGKLPTLLGVYDSTKTYSKKNRVTLYGSEFESLIDDNTYAPATLDSEGKTVTFDEEHWQVVSNGTGAFLAGEKLDQFSFEENPEFVEAKTDSDGKLTETTDVEGKKTFYGDVEVKGNIINKELDEKVSSAAESLGTINTELTKKVDKEDGKILIDENVADNFSEEDNPEFIAVNTDTEDKIIDSTDAEGNETHNTKHTFNCGAKIVGLELDDDSSANLKKGAFDYISNNASDLAKTLKANGLGGVAMADFSDVEHVEIPEPANYAIVNLIIDALPVADSDVAEGYIEYYDKAGNYFKKKCELTTQGQTSAYFARTGGKGNYTLDITDDSDIKFGAWVPQDSFHFKGCAKDVTRAYLSTSYKLAEKLMNALDAKPNRVLLNEDVITTTKATGDRFTDWIDDARCLPDGFPFEVYVNGEYWGLYSWQLKKDRKNYSMKKTDYTSFFIDADALMSSTYDDGFWLGDIWWTKFEIKGPKNLVCMDGSDYDGDSPKELIDSTSEYYDANNKKHVGSMKTKNIIQSFSTRYLAVKALVDTGDDDSIVQAKTLFNEYFDYNACMFVYIFNCLMKNEDSVMKNTLWGIYSNGKIAPMLWDLDGMYGQGWVGNQAGSPDAKLWKGAYATASWPLGLFWSLYENEIKAAYSNLRKNNVISMDTWENVVYGWVKRVGTEAYERDIEKWNETPSYRENYTNTEYWAEYGGIIGSAGFGTATAWDETTEYAIGDMVYLKAHPNVGQYHRYTAVKASTGVCPVTKYYDGFPQIGGFYDSPKRMRKWMEKQLQLCDTVMEYSN